MNEHDATQDIIVNGYVRRIAELERKLEESGVARSDVCKKLLEANKQLAERDAQLKVAIEALAFYKNVTWEPIRKDRFHLIAAEALKQIGAGDV